MDNAMDSLEAGLPLPVARCLSKEQAAAYLGIGRSEEHTSELQSL